MFVYLNFRDNFHNYKHDYAIKTKANAKAGKIHIIPDKVIASTCCYYFYIVTGMNRVQ